jgi:hypothetical protein
MRLSPSLSTPSEHAGAAEAGAAKSISVAIAITATSDAVRSLRIASPFGIWSARAVPRVSVPVRCPSGSLSSYTCMCQRLAFALKHSSAIAEGRIAGLFRYVGEDSPTAEVSSSSPQQ